MTPLLLLMYLILLLISLIGVLFLFLRARRVTKRSSTVLLERLEEFAQRGLIIPIHEAELTLPLTDRLITPHFESINYFLNDFSLSKLHRWSRQNLLFFTILLAPTFIAIPFSIRSWSIPLFIAVLICSYELRNQNHFSKLKRASVLLVIVFLILAIINNSNLFLISLTIFLIIVQIWFPKYNVPLDTKIVISGITGGLLLSQFLVSPILPIINSSNPSIFVSSERLPLALIISFFIAPTAVLWSQKKGIQAKFFIGALSFGICGFILGVSLLNEIIPRLITNLESEAYNLIDTIILRLPLRTQLLFSLPPIIILMITVAGSIFGGLTALLVPDKYLESKNRLSQNSPFHFAFFRSLFYLLIPTQLINSFFLMTNADQIKLLLGVYEFNFLPRSPNFFWIALFPWLGMVGVLAAYALRLRSLFVQFEKNKFDKIDLVELFDGISGARVLGLVNIIHLIILVKIGHVLFENHTFIIVGTISILLSAETFRSAWELWGCLQSMPPTKNLREPISSLVPGYTAGFSVAIMMMIITFMPWDYQYTGNDFSPTSKLLIWIVLPALMIWILWFFIYTGNLTKNKNEYRVRYWEHHHVYPSPWGILEKISYEIEKTLGPLSKSNKNKSTNIAIIFLVVGFASWNVFLSWSNITFELLIICALIASFILFQAAIIKQFPWRIFLMAFVISAMGLLLPFLIKFPFEQLQNNSILRFAYVSLFCPSVIVSYRSIIHFGWPKQVLPVFAILFLPISIGVFLYADGQEVDVAGGISIFNGYAWDNLRLNDNIFIPTQNDYDLVLGEDNNVGFVSDDGYYYYKNTDDEWAVHHFEPDTDVSSYTDVPLVSQPQNAIRLPATDGRIWMAYGTNVGIFDPGYFKSGSLNVVRRVGQPLSLKDASIQDIDIFDYSLPEIWGIAFQNKGCSVGAIRMWDNQGNLLAEFYDGGSSIGNTRLSPNADRILSLDILGTVRLRNTAGDLINVLNRKSLAKIISIDFSPDGNTILTLDQSGNVSLWDQNGVFMKSISQEFTSRGAVLSPDGTKILTIESNQTAHLWSIQGDLVVEMKDHTQSISHGGFSPDGRWAFTAGSSEVRIWNVSDSFMLNWGDYLSSINNMGFSADGNLFYIVGDSRQSVQFWDSDWQPAGNIRIDQSITNIHIFPDKTVALSNFSGDVEHWSIETGYISTIDQNAEVAFSNSGLYFVTWGVEVTEVESDQSAQNPQIIYEPFIHSYLVNDQKSEISQIPNYTFSPLGRKDTLTSTISSIGISPDGTYFIASSSEGVKIWDTETLNSADLQSKAGFSVAGPVEFSPNNDGFVIPFCVLTSYYQFLAFDSQITDMVEDSQGRIWISTEGDGLARVDNAGVPENAQWKFFNTSNSPLLSDEVNDILLDRDGSLLFGTSGGLNRFDNDTWESIKTISNENIDEVSALYGSRDGLLWIGTNGGLYQVEEKGLSSVELDGASGQIITSIFEDQDGEIWIGTNKGALRSHDGVWQLEFADIEVTKIVETADGKLWIGSNQGLYLFDQETQSKTVFNNLNSSINSSQVQDLSVNKNGVLYISTQPTLGQYRSWGFPFVWEIVLFSVLLGGTYYGFRRHPDTIAQRESSRIINGSIEEIIRFIYDVSLNFSNPSEHLNRIAWQLGSRGDFNLSSLLYGFAELQSTNNVAKALSKINTALEDQTRSHEPTPIHQIYCLYYRMLNAINISEVFELELQIRESYSSVGFVIQTSNANIQYIPESNQISSFKVWQALEKITTILEKYNYVDAPGDQLSYLVEAYTNIELGRELAQLISTPENFIFSSILNNWGKIIQERLDYITGRASIRVELISKQVIWDKQITLLLKLSNVGNASAENITFTLIENNEFVPEIQTFELSHLLSSRSEKLEVKIIPKTDTDMRILCHVTWSDRIDAFQELEYGDIVRFYKTSEEFSPIPNPFIVGHPIKSSEMFQGREDVFRFISESIGKASSDHTVVLHGQRRTGKTSILYQLLNGKLGPGFIPLLVDMQELAPIVRNTADFLFELAYHLFRNQVKLGLQLAAPVLQNYENSPYREFSRFLDIIGDELFDKKLLLMIDEFELIETKIHEGKMEVDLLGYFRSLMQHRDWLTFIFTGTHRLEEMSHDYWSVLFNIALYRRISFLDEEDAVKLICNPLKGELDIDEIALDKIINLTRGHPYFTQLLAWQLVRFCNDKKRNFVTINDLNDALEDILTYGESHFAYVWQQSSWEERLVLTSVAHSQKYHQHWVRLEDIFSLILRQSKDAFTKDMLIQILEDLTSKEILETTREYPLQYRFYIDILRLWISKNHHLTTMLGDT